MLAILAALALGQLPLYREATTSAEWPPSDFVRGIVVDEPEGKVCYDAAPRIRLFTKASGAGVASGIMTTPYDWMVYSIVLHVETERAVSTHRIRLEGKQTARLSFLLGEPHAIIKRFAVAACYGTNVPLPDMYKGLELRPPNLAMRTGW